LSVRVGIVSFAHVHSPAYAGVLRDLAAADFVGITDEDTDRGAEAAEQFGVRYFDSAATLSEEVDAVVVCSENKNHANDVIPALQGGVHVLSEKPIATTVEDARAMIQASENSGSQLRTAFPVRYLPSVVRARDLVRGGALGRVLAVNGTNHGRIPGGWFLDPELAGGGAVMDHTVHLADLLRWILDVEVKSVYAEVDSFFGAEETDDAAILTLDLEGGSFADGAFATIDPSWSRGDGYPTWGDVTLRIAGTSGVLDVDPFAQPLRTFVAWRKVFPRAQAGSMACERWRSSLPPTAPPKTTNRKWWTERPKALCEKADPQWKTAPTPRLNRHPAKP
jgi:predicted dehydrogenase